MLSYLRNRIRHIIFTLVVQIYKNICEANSTRQKILLELAIPFCKSFDSTILKPLFAQTGDRPSLKILLNESSDTKTTLHNGSQ